MKLFLQSDLHLEMGGEPDPPPQATDVLIWAGDIHYGAAVIELAARQAQRYQLDVIVVAGNHEFYNDDHEAVIRLMAHQAGLYSRVHFLENQALQIGNTRFFGATFWSDFAFLGEAAAKSARDACERFLPDYRIITKGGTVLTTQASLAMHQASLQRLENWLGEPWSGATVVITHFAPHPGCDHPRHAGSPFTPYFISDQRRLMENYRPDVWCYGHTHDSMDFYQGQTRIISNQGGYPKEGGVRDCYRDELQLLVG